jgi:hypothetical protein
MDICALKEKELFTSLSDDTKSHYMCFQNTALGKYLYGSSPMRAFFYLFGIKDCFFLDDDIPFTSKMSTLNFEDILNKINVSANYLLEDEDFWVLLSHLEYWMTLHIRNLYDTKSHTEDEIADGIASVEQSFQAMIEKEKPDIEQLYFESRCISLLLLADIHYRAHNIEACKKYLTECGLLYLTLAKEYEIKILEREKEINKMCESMSFADIMDSLRYNNLDNERYEEQRFKMLGTLCSELGIVTTIDKKNE